MPDQSEHHLIKIDHAFCYCRENQNSITLIAFCFLVQVPICSGTNLH